jgi:hypothetical protein
MPNANSTSPRVQLLRLEWQRLSRERRLAADAATAGLLMPDAADVVAREEQELLLLQQHQMQMWGWGAPPAADMDALMADAMAREEAEELDALVAGLEERGFSDDEEYDELFMDFIEQEQEQGREQGQDVEMS